MKYQKRVSYYSLKQANKQFKQGRDKVAAAAFEGHQSQTVKKEIPDYPARQDHKRKQDIVATNIVI